MDIQADIEALLRARHPAWFDRSWRLVRIQELAYRFETGAKAYFVKWILANNFTGLNEIKINQTWLPDANVHTPRLLTVIPDDEGCLAVWEWVKGEDLRFKHRELLPRAYTEIGHFHNAHRTLYPITGPLSKQTYPSILDMLKGELDLLSAGFPDPIPRSSLILHLLPGYATRIHGDLHPGNIHASGNLLYFTDWGGAINTLNLFELEYIRRVNLDPEGGPGDWWVIRPAEARAVLPAYFEASGLSGCNIAATHWAVMLWAELHSYYNSRIYRNPEGSEICRSNIAQLTEMEGKM